VTIDDIVITEPDEIDAQFSATNVTCFGADDGAVDLTVAGGTAPYSFIWSNGATTEDVTDLPAGTYSVTITDANLCTVTIDDIVITEPDEIDAQFSATNVTCFGADDGAVDLTVAGGTAPYSFIWSNGATTEDVTDLPAGTYSVTITDANLCTVTIDDIVI